MEMHQIVNRLISVYCNRVEFDFIGQDRCEFTIKGFSHFIVDEYVSVQEVNSIADAITPKATRNADLIKARILNYVRDDEGNLSPRKFSFDEVNKALRDAGGSGWDDIEDPTAFIREMRGEL